MSSDILGNLQRTKLYGFLVYGAFWPVIYLAEGRWGGVKVRVAMLKDVIVHIFMAFYITLQTELELTSE